MPRLCRTRPAIPVLAVLVLAAGPAAAQEDNGFLQVGPYADVERLETSNSWPVHVTANAGLDTADYFRGRFDGVAEDLDDLAWRLGASLSVELLNRPVGPVEGLSFTAGTTNGLSDTPVATDGVWYESNNWVGLAARFGSIDAGLTWVRNGGPDVPGSASQELDASLQYRAEDRVGSLSPQIKVAKPIDDGEGVFLRAALTPSADLGTVGGNTLGLSFPLVGGLGVDDYYGAGTGTAAYGSIGAVASLPLKQLDRFGSWKLALGIEVILRQDEIAQAGGPLDDAGNVVTVGSIGLSVAY